MEDNQEFNGSNEKNDSLNKQIIQQKGNSKHKTIISVFFLLLILAVAIVGFYFYIDYANQWISTNNAFVDGRIFNVAATLPGIIDKIHLQEGVRVAKGEPLVTIARCNETILQLGEERFLYPQLMRIFSPSNGYIAHMLVDEGEYVLLGQTLMSVVNLDNLWIKANFTESQVRYIKIGQKVDIYIDAYPAETLRGQVASIMPAVGSAFALFPPDATAGNWVRVSQRIPVKIMFDKDRNKDDMRLKIGMLARVRVER